MTTFSVRHVAERTRFEMVEMVDGGPAGGAVIGKAVYSEYDGGESPQRIFYHTVINQEFGGQGLAGRLAAAALQETVAADRGSFRCAPSSKSTSTSIWNTPHRRLLSGPSTLLSSKLSWPGRSNADVTMSSTEPRCDRLLP